MRLKYSFINIPIRMPFLILIVGCGIKPMKPIEIADSRPSPSSSDGTIASQTTQTATANTTPATSGTVPGANDSVVVEQKTFSASIHGDQNFGQDYLQKGFSLTGKIQIATPDVGKAGCIFVVVKNKEGRISFQTPQRAVSSQEAKTSDNQLPILIPEAGAFVCYPSLPKDFENVIFFFFFNSAADFVGTKIYLGYGVGASPQGAYDQAIRLN